LRRWQRRPSALSVSLFAVSESVPSPGSESPSQAAVAVAGRSLVALVSERLPQEFPQTAERWLAYRTALVARMADIVESVISLMEQGRDSDGGVLVRVLYEHVVKYCWIAEAPSARLLRWRADAVYWEHKLDDDLADYGMIVPENQRLKGEARQLPPMIQLADEVDRYWGERLIGFTPRQQGEAGMFTLRGLYNPIYRTLSETVHARPEATRATLDPLSRPLRVFMAEPLDHIFWWGLVVPLYAQALLVCNTQIGWPDPDTVRAINNGMYR
jgi:Family of unknown function (DUF5677)